MRRTSRQLLNIVTGQRAAPDEQDDATDVMEGSPRP